MADKKSTEGTVGQEEQSSPFDIGKGGILLIAVMIALAAIAFVIFGGEGADVSSVEDEIVDPVKSGDGFEAGANVSEETEEETTSTTKDTAEIEATSSADSKLLKEIGPFNLLPYGETVDGTTVFAVQKESFTLEGSNEDYFVGITSTREPGISFSGFPTEPIIILMVLKDENGNSVSSEKDETTGNIYYARLIVDPNPTTLPYVRNQAEISEDKKRTAKTWEVLVYSY